MTDKPVTGRCLCGDIRYEYRGTPVKILHCHCESCRRHTSSPVATFVCVPRESFRFTQGEPVTYEFLARRDTHALRTLRRADDLCVGTQQPGRSLHRHA